LSFFFFFLKDGLHLRFAFPGDTGAVASTALASNPAGNGGFATRLPGELWGDTPRDVS